MWKLYIATAVWSIGEYIISWIFTITIINSIRMFTICHWSSYHEYQLRTSLFFSSSSSSSYSSSSSSCLWFVVQCLALFNGEYPMNNQYTHITYSILTCQLESFAWDIRRKTSILLLLRDANSMLVYNNSHLSYFGSISFRYDTHAHWS